MEDQLKRRVKKILNTQKISTSGSSSGGQRTYFESVLMIRPMGDETPQSDGVGQIMKKPVNQPWSDGESLHCNSASITPLCMDMPADANALISTFKPLNYTLVKNHSHYQRYLSISSRI